MEKCPSKLPRLNTYSKASKKYEIKLNFKLIKKNMRIVYFGCKIVCFLLQIKKEQTAHGQIEIDGTQTCLDWEMR